MSSSLSSYPIPASEARGEIIVVNSRFIASAAPVFSIQDAKKFIARIKGEFPDASHHVPAYIIGYGSTLINHCQDDGEPSGTAGRPALAVLSGSGLGDVAVVVTRYFGGTKLGSGGLVHAYSDAIRAVLQVLPRARRVPTYTVMLVIPYTWFERLRLLIAAHHGSLLDEEFAGDITLSVRFAQYDFAAFQKALREFSQATLQAEIIDSGETILPLQDPL